MLSALKHDYVARGMASHPRFELAVVADDPHAPDWAHERNQQKHGCRMNLRQVAGQQKCLQIHQARDREPAFDSCGTGWCSRGICLKVADEEIEFRTEPDIQSEKQKLDDLSNSLRMIGECAADVVFFELHRPLYLLPW